MSSERESIINDVLKRLAEIKLLEETAAIMESNRIGNEIKRFDGTLFLTLYGSCIGGAICMYIGSRINKHVNTDKSHPSKINEITFGCVGFILSGILIYKKASSRPVYEYYK
jgi:hypothetical protein